MVEPLSEATRRQTLAAYAAARDEDLNAVTQVADFAAVESALAAALNTDTQLPRTTAQGEGDPLRGRALAVKDNIHVAGMRNTAATAALGDFVPDTDAEVVARLRRRGVVIIAKTNMHELAVGVTGSHTATGPVVNPVDRALVPGGSSAGSAALLAAGVCELALGSDTGGSTRIPAAFTDTWGFRPSTGRYDADGGTSIAFSRDTVGPMARSLEGLRVLDSAMALTDDVSTLPPAVRVGYDPAEIELCEPAVATAFRAVIEALESTQSCTVVEVPLDRLNRVARGFEPELGPHELAPSLRSYLASSPQLPTLERVIEQLADPHVAAMITDSIEATADGVWTDTWRRLMIEIARLRLSYQRLLAEHRLDATIRPTVPILPRLMTEVRAMSLDERDALFGRTTHFAGFATLIGAPSLSLPLGPLIGHRMTGVTVESAPGCDVELLELGRRIEAVLRG